MDVFARTFWPAAAEAGVARTTVTRHMAIFQRCVEADDAAVLVSRCARPVSPMQGEFLLLVTHRRMVVTQETLVLRRLRLHLNTELRHLSNVTWQPDSRTAALELAATAVDGVREHFRIKVRHPKQVWHLDALLTYVFRPRTATPWPGTPISPIDVHTPTFSPAAVF